MLNVGDTVKLLSPFDVIYPGTFTIESIRTLEDGNTAIRISMGSDFDPQFLEKI